MAEVHEEKSLADLQKEIQALRNQIEAAKKTDDRVKSYLGELSVEKAIELELCDFRSTKKLEGHFGKIYAMHWASDSTHLASASQDGKLMIWDGITTNKRHMINLRSSWVMTCAYAPSMQFVACGGLDNLCSIYPISFDTAETHDRPKHELSKHDGYLSCCRFLDDESILTSSGDGTLILWNIKKQTAWEDFGDHEADVMSVATRSRDQFTFVSGSCDQTAKVWDTRTPNGCTMEFIGHTSDINSVQWFPDEVCFGSGSDDATVRLFDTRAYQQCHHYADDQVRCGVTSIDFSSTGKYLFCGYDDAPFAAVWDSLYGKINQNLPATKRVSCLGVPKNGYCLCTGSWDNNLHIWTRNK